MSPTQPIAGSRIAKPLLLPLLTFSLVACVLLATADDAHALLYDVDFSTPPHTVGQPPATGGGPPPRETVSQILTGDPTVLASVGALTHQPLRLNSFDGSRDKISFRLDNLPASDHYCLMADVLVNQADDNGQLDFVLDAPTRPTIHFQGDGTIKAFVSGVTADSLVIGHYALGDVVGLQISIDLVTDIWEISLDGVLKFLGYIESAEEIVAIEAVEVATAGVTGNARVRGAIDNLTIIATVCSDELCDRLSFEDLTPGDVYPTYTSFLSDRVMILVTPFFFGLGPCSGPFSTGAAEVEAGLGNACRTGNEIHLTDATLDFGFGEPVNDVVIYYGDQDGTVSLGLNGECQTVFEFTALNGTNQGGVTVDVFDYGPPGGCGAIRLIGEITSLSIGGMDLWIDALSYCRSCPERPRSAFEDLTPGSFYLAGDEFVSGDATYTCRLFYPSAGCTGPGDHPYLYVDNNGSACGFGNELGMSSGSVEIDFGETVAWIALNYGELGGDVNLKINGDCRHAANLNALNGAYVGGARVIVADFGPSGQSCGTLYAVGPISQFVIGGRALAIDTVRACTGTTVGIADPIMTPPPGEAATLMRLEQNHPNPFHSATEIAFELATPMPARITIYDVTGRAVRTLIEGMVGVGRHDVRWDAYDTRGDRVPSGVYTYRLEAGGIVETRQMIVLK
jgi:hypothetical protein